MARTGSCNCGSISLAVEGEPLTTRQCWCRQCQKIAAGGPTNNAIFKTEDITVSGSLSWYSHIAASGNTLYQGFCPTCGCHLIARSEARPNFRTIRLGALDEPYDLRPENVIWLDEAPAWAMIDPEMNPFSGQPPPPRAD